MKTGKRILSIVLALLMMTTACSSALVASACTENNHDAYAEASDLLDLIDKKLDAYDVDIVSLIDGLVDGKSLLDTADGYISTEALNGYLEGYLAQYLENGQWLLDMADTEIVKLLNKYLKVSVIDGVLDENFNVDISGLLSSLPEIYELDDIVLQTLADSFGIASVDDLRQMLPTIEEFDQMVNNAISQYVDDGTYLVELLDGLIQQLLESKVGLQYTDGVLSGVDGELVNDELLNSIIEQYLGDYICDGGWLVDYADTYVSELVNKYANVDYLNELVQTMVLADNSSVMQSVCNMLSGMLPIDTSDGATYVAVIKALIPILSCLSIDNIMAMDFTVASPTAFYYLAGLDVDSAGNKLSYEVDEVTYPSYFDYVNTVLSGYGSFTPVEPLIALTDDQAQELLKYVQLEKDGTALSEIQGEGFDWTNYVTDSNAAEIANALIKIDLGDASKLGDIISGLSGGESSEIDPGADLAYILIDLVSDLKTDPVRILIKKLGSSQFGELITFVVDLLDGLSTPDYASYKLWSSSDYSEQRAYLESIGYKDPATGEYYDFIEVEEVEVDGETTLVYSYKHGGLDMYLDVVDSAKILLNGLWDTLEGNDEDILKTLLVDKLDDLEDLLYKAVKLIVNMGLSTVDKLEDQKVADGILINFVKQDIASIESEIAAIQANIDAYQQFADELKVEIEQAQIDYAVENGLLSEGTTSYDESAVQAAINDKVSELSAQQAELIELQEESQAKCDELEEQIAQLNDFAGEYEDVVWEWIYYIEDGNDLQDPEFIEFFNKYLTHRYNEYGEPAKLDSPYLTWYTENEDLISDGEYAELSAIIQDEYMYASLDAVGLQIEELEGELNAESEVVAGYDEEIEALETEINEYTTVIPAELQNIVSTAKKFVGGDAYDENNYRTLEQLEYSIQNLKESIDAKSLDIAAANAKILDYEADIASCDQQIADVDVEGYEAELYDFNNIVANLASFIRGDEADANLYSYYVENGLIGAVLSEGRLGYLKGLLDSVIDLFDYFSGVTVDGVPIVEHKSELHTVVDTLFSDVLDGLYEDFIADPIGAVASRVDGIVEIVDEVYDMGFFRTYIDDYRGLIDDVVDILNDEFVDAWSENKAGALLASLGKIVNLLDDALEIEQIADLAAPYSDLIDLVKYLISEDFYNELYAAPLEYILSDETLGTLFGTDGTDGLVGQLLDLFISDETANSQYKQIVADAYNNVLYYLYHDFVTNPVVAVADRVDDIVAILNEVVPLLPEEAQNVVGGFSGIIADIQAIFDDSFSEDWLASKIITIADRLPAVLTLINDILDNETIMDLIKSAASDYADIIEMLKADYPAIKAELEKVASQLVDDYNDDCLKAILDRVDPLLEIVNIIAGDSDLINAVLGLDVFQSNELLADLTPTIKAALAIVPDCTAYLKEIVNMDTVENFFGSPIYTAVGLLPDVLGLVNSVLSDSDLVNAVLSSKTVGSMVIGDYEIADFSTLIKIVCRDFASWIDPINAILNEDFLNTYSSDKLMALLSRISPILDLVDAIVSDSELVDEVLAVDFVDELLSDYSDLIKALLANFSSIKSILVNLINAVVSEWEDSKTTAIVAAIPYIEKLIKKLSSIPDAAAVIQPFKNTIEVLMNLLSTISIKGDKIIIGFLGNKPLEAVLDQTFVSQLMSAAKEITPLIADGAYTDLVESVLYVFDGLLFHLRNSDLIYTVQLLATRLNTAVSELKKTGLFEEQLSPYYGAIDALLAVFDKSFHDEFFASPVDSILARVPQLRALLEELTKIDALKNLSIGSIQISDFLPIIKTAVKLLDNSFYSEFKQSPIMALLHRATYISSIAKDLIATGLLDSIEIFGFKVVDLIKIVLPLLSDNEIYEDVCDSLIGALISTKRLATVCRVLKDAVAYIDIFASGVNNGIYQLIDGLYGVLNGLYEELSLSGGTNVSNRTSRVIVNRLPAIQNLFHELSGLVGEGKLINLTNAVSDAPVIFKTLVLDTVAGVDMISPYYYGISDILDALNEYLGEGDYNTLTGMINSLNDLGPKLIPILEDALSVSGVEWSALSVPTCNYSGTAEDYIVELSGQIGENVLTPLVDTLAAAALTIPAVQDLVGEIQVTDLAGLLNDLLEFDFKNDELEFDAFNTEHLIITAVNLLMPNEVSEGSASTADQTILIVAMVGIGVGAAFTVAMTIRRRKEDCE